MHIAIVDDEAQERERLRGYFTRFGSENGHDFSLCEFASGNALLDGYKPIFDILVFDIDMPGLNGIETARRVRTMDRDVVILFITNIAQYAINGYEVEAVDYIIKPISYFDFAMKLQRAMQRVIRRQDAVLLIDSVDGSVRVQISDIRYVEVMGHYLIYHTAERNVKARGSMKDAEDRLRPHQFGRVHKSYLVNYSSIESINGGELLVAGDHLPLGRAYKDSLMQEFMQYLQS